jgi:hypothetical protein
MARSVIEEYLVSLGWTVDAPSQRRFEDALKLSAVKAEKFGKDITIGFLAAGSAFAALATGIIGAGVGIASSLAKQDLQYQLLGRRMFMGTESARKMQIALDALGVSLEDVIFGPPELQERYRTLAADQDRMMQAIGGFAGVEAGLRKVRDITFQFTRMGPELQMFGVALTEDVINKLFGGNESLEERLKEFNSWFQSPQGFAHIADVASNVIAPALRGIGKAAMWAFDKLGEGLKGLNEFLAQRFGTELGGPGKYSRAWFNQHPGGYTLEQLAPPGMLTLDHAKQAYEDIKKGYEQGGIGGAWEASGGGGQNYIGAIMDDAKKMGIPAGLALAIAEQESDFNPNAPIGSHGEIGMFQLMPDTIKKLQQQMPGFNPNDPFQNIWGGLQWLQEKPGATWADKVKAYNGSGAAADSYRDQVLDKWKNNYEMRDFAPGAAVRPQSYSGGGMTINGGIMVNVASAHATPEQISMAVQDGIQKAARIEGTRMYAAVQGGYA